MTNEKLLAHFHIKGTNFNETHPIYHWEGYGVVCPSLCTTNGSKQFLVDVINQYIEFQEDKKNELKDENYCVWLEGGF